MTMHWKAAEQYFTVVLFVFQFYPVCNFGKFIRFGLGIVRSERVNGSVCCFGNRYSVYSCMVQEYSLSFVWFDRPGESSPEKDDKTTQMTETPGLKPFTLILPLFE